MNPGSENLTKEADSEVLPVKSSSKKSKSGKRTEPKLRACDACRDHKVRCGRQLPICEYCIKHFIPCTRNNLYQKRGPKAKNGKEREALSNDLVSDSIKPSCENIQPEQVHTPTFPITTVSMTSNYLNSDSILHPTTISLLTQSQNEGSIPGENSSNIDIFSNGFCTVFNQSYLCHMSQSEIKGMMYYFANVDPYVSPISRKDFLAVLASTLAEPSFELIRLITLMLKISNFFIQNQHRIEIIKLKVMEFVESVNIEGYVIPDSVDSTNPLLVRAAKVLEDLLTYISFDPV